MEEYGIYRKAIPLAIRELVALGFIEVTEQGCAGNAEFRSPSKYRVTYRHVDRANPTDEWRRIKTDDEATMIAQGARRKGTNSATRKGAIQKQNPRGGLHHVSGVETTPENDNSPGVETTPTALGVETTPTIDISGGGGDVAVSLSEPEAKTSMDGTDATDGMVADEVETLPEPEPVRLEGESLADFYARCDRWRAGEPEPEPADRDRLRRIKAYLMSTSGMLAVARASGGRPH
jgi:hypothetical protein